VIAYKSTASTTTHTHPLAQLSLVFISDTTTTIQHSPHGQDGRRAKNVLACLKRCRLQRKRRKHRDHTKEGHNYGVYVCVHSSSSPLLSLPHTNLLSGANDIQRTCKEGSDRATDATGQKMRKRSQLVFQTLMRRSLGCMWNDCSCGRRFPLDSRAMIDNVRRVRLRRIGSR
jgi:hypothetical protein